MCLTNGHTTDLVRVRHGSPNLIQMLNQAQTDYPCRSAAAPSHQAPVSTPTQQLVRSQTQSIALTDPGCQSPTGHATPSGPSAGALPFSPSFCEKLAELSRKLQKTSQHEDLGEKDLSSNDEEDSLAQSWLKIIKPSSVTLIVGKRGSGKTSALHKILEYCRHRGTCYLVGFPKEAKGGFLTGSGLYQR